MASDDLISQTEAESLTGLSSSTLTRFAEAGYLWLVDAQFRRGELVALFGNEMAKSSIQGSAVTASPVAVSETSEELVAATVPLDGPFVSPAAPPIDEEAPWYEQELPEAMLEEPLESDPPPRLENRIEVENSDTFTEAANKQDLPSGMSEENWKRMLLLQEKVIAMRESELSEVRRERDWLKERIEKLEHKSERDQLLLLSETQTIRQLLAYREEERRSFVQVALEWLGLKGADQSSAKGISRGLVPSHTSSTSIEVSRSEKDSSN